MSIEKEEYKILIVDDSEENRLVLAEICKSLGYLSEHAIDGSVAMAKIQQSLPAAILLDIRMTGMDGFEVLEKVKNHPKWKDIPVIMITSLDDSETILKCLQMGADDYIPKPFEPILVKARLERAIVNLSYLRKEKMVLEKTFSGSMKILSDIISSLSPVLFGKASKVRRIARLIAEEMNYGEIWEIDVASIFSLVGCISLTPDLIEKIVTNRSLTSEEKKLYDNHPILGYKLLNNIPRLGNVAKIVLLQNITKVENLPKELTGFIKEIPLGSKILRAAFEYEQATLKSNNIHELKSVLKNKEPSLDSEVYSALEKVLQKESNREIKSIPVNQISIGMTFTEDVFTTTGVRVVSKMQEATESVIERIRAVHTKLPIVEPLKVYMSRN
jgi:response regulator RpfG family c-di-GMP phosphodiesterase